MNEKEKQWREDFMNYFSSSGNRYPKSIMESFFAGRKAGQEETNNIFNAAYEAGALSMKEEIDRLRAEVEKLKAENKQLRMEEAINREARILMISQDEENIKAYESENNRLKDLVNRARGFEGHAHWCRWEDDDECNCGFEQWLEDVEKEIGG